MMALSDDVESIARTIWDSVLDSPIFPGDEVMLDEESQVTSIVQLHGAFEGLVMIQCPEGLGSRLAAAMLHAEESATREDMTDALGELANMFAGNLKALLPKPSFISLPAVAFGPQDERIFDGVTVVARVPFVCDAEPLVVTILSRSAA